MIFHQRVTIHPAYQAVEILDADEAHENFAKTFSFLQDDFPGGGFRIFYQPLPLL